MSIIEWINTNATIISLITTITLVIITAVYVFFTKRILDTSVQQSKLAYNPVIGINLDSMIISEVFGPDRRNMNINLELTNVGNAPAIEVIVDAEITFTYSNIQGEKTIPARFEPENIPFIRPNEELDQSSCSSNFGNTLITHLFDDFREANRLNIHRIKTDPTQESYNASCLKIIIYYRNNIGQYFESNYETYLHLESTNDNEFPKDNESAELKQIYIPRPKFHTSPISKEKMDKEISVRNSKRELCGW